MVKFGIVIATYRRPDGKTPFYLTRALKSILDQTHKNFKIFLIGDRYDNEEEFEKFGKAFISEKIHKENLPVAMERDFYTNKEALWSYGGWNASNYGIDLAVAEGIRYICRLDHDDYWTPDHLSNFQNLINLHDPVWMSSKSTFRKNRTLPPVEGKGEFLPFIPRANVVIKSSTCVDQKRLPFRTRNIFKETGKVGLPGDADMWQRAGEYIKRNKLKSYVVNKLTCFHDEEGYTKL